MYFDIILRYSKYHTIIIISRTSVCLTGIRLELGSLEIGRNRYGGGDHLSAKTRKMLRDAGIGDDRGSNSGGWTDRTPGTLESGEEVTFKQGLGENEGHTLIADGSPSGQAFERRKEHDHYGPNRENDGRVEDEGGHRGYYTGPGS